MHKLHLLAIACSLAATTAAQTPSGSTDATAGAVPHTTVPFRIDDQGQKLPDIQWGLDLAWLWDQNVLRGIAFAGEDLIDIIRISFQTTNTEALNGSLTAAQKKTLDDRIRIAKRAPKATINLNSDQMEGNLEQVTNYYRSSSSTTQATRWAELIYLTKKYVESKGLTVSSVSPFNEPDYTNWHQGTKADFLAICRKLRTDDTYRDEFADVALCGGNTLNNDRALEWYDYCKLYLDEGNTHQLAGSFDSFVNFYKQVAADGKVGVADELHNTMEAMVASEYGLGKAIWWGTCDHTRSQFMRASRGTRMGYAENRSNWTAASVYRHTDGSVQGFGGTSERQATETTFRFAATDHDVFFNGHGPTREYNMTLPGGTGYQKGQTNAEALVNIQGGDDVMPPLPLEATTYRIVNRASGLLLAPANNTPAVGANVCQLRAATNTGQQWTVAPVEIRVGGDFSYYRLASAKNANVRLAVDRWTIDDGANVYMSLETDINNQWTIEYAGDGWFYLRNRQSGHYLQVSPTTSATAIRAANRNVNQGKFSGEPCQQWRFLPVEVKYDAVAPAPPTQLNAHPQSASIRLTWTAPADDDVATYTILRSTDQTTWHVINQGIAATGYTDNTVLPATTYYYKVRARDASLNLSEAGNVASAAPTDAQTCIMHIAADSLADSTPNGNHAALRGTANLVEGINGSQALQLDGSTQFVQLPATIAASRELTVATWVNWTGGGSWQRLFDFGLDTDHYFFVSPRNGSTSKLRIAIKNGSAEHYADAASALATNSWQHVAAVFGTDAIRLYVNGQPVATLNASERPADFMPIFNYVGRSQFRNDPMLKGSIDEVRIYNYALSADELARLANGESVGIAHTPQHTTGDAATAPTYRIDGTRVEPSQMRSRQIYISRGRKTLIR